MRFLKIKALLLLILLLSGFSSSAGAEPLKVLTLNTWLLKFLGHSIGKDLEARLRVIPSMVSETGADLIALQEVWPNRYKKRLVKDFKTLGYAYSFYVPRETGLGNGLMVVSKYPIVYTQVSEPYSAITVTNEVMAQKGAIYAEIELAPGKRVDFFTTHAGALTFDGNHETYHAGQRTRQIKQYIEFRDWVKATRRHERSIISGDFNADYRTLKNNSFLPEYAEGYLKLIGTGCSNQEDFLNTYLVANEMNEKSPPHPTYDNENPYVSSGYFSNAPSETEDYIFSCGIKSSEVKFSEVQFSDEISNDRPEFFGLPLEKRPVRISDHYGLMTTFEL